MKSNKSFVVHDAVKRWESGAITSDEAMRLIAEAHRLPKPKRERKSTVDHDVSGFLAMANAIVESRRESSER